MQEFEQIESAEGDLFLMDWDYETMVRRVLLSFIARQKLTGEAVDFGDPVLAETLDELNKARELLLSKGIESYSEAEIYWESEIVGEHSIFHYGQGSSTRSTYLWNKHALPAFVFAEGDTPAYTGSMRVLVVNPNTPQKEQAEAFVALLTKPEYGIMQNYVFHTDAVQPYVQGHYQITESTIDKWQSAVSAIRISADDPLQTEAFTTQSRTLIERYAAGQMDAQTFLRKISETAAMMEREVR